jgi:hypothetical protein
VATDDLRMHRVVQQGPFTTLVLSLRNYCGKLRKTSPDPQSECPPAFTAAQIQANGLVRGQLMFDIPAGESPKLLRYTLDDTVVIAGLRY